MMVNFAASHKYQSLPIQMQEFILLAKTTSLSNELFSTKNKKKKKRNRPPTTVVCFIFNSGIYFLCMDAAIVALIYQYR